MAPLEQVIWEAKHKPRTLKDARPASTTVDETGCIITRGFLIPSRSSSIDSLARSSISSFETTGTPASPVDEAPPGYTRPIGALCDAPELQILQTRSPAALCRPSKSDGNLTTYAGRPPLGDRRRTWQVDRVARSISHLRRGSSSRWHDVDLAEVTCQPNSSHGQRAQLGVLAHAQAHLVAAKQNRGHIKRVKSSQVKLSQLNLQNTTSKQRKKAPISTNKDCEIGGLQGNSVEEASTTDGAIASESEDDFSSDGEWHVSTGRSARPNYATYAERRAKADERVPSRPHRIPAQYQMNARSSSLLCSPSENAIESDDEDDDIAACKSDRKISARLSLAQIHCTQNALATKVDLGQLPKRRKSPLSVSIAPTALTTLTVAGQSAGRGNTSAKVNTFEPDTRVANRQLRLSRTQPRPAKGVLKNAQATAET